MSYKQRKREFLLWLRLWRRGRVRRISNLGASALRVKNGYQGLIEFLGEVARGMALLPFMLHRFRWRDFAYYLDLCGWRTLPIVFGICYLMGLVLAFQGGLYMRDYGLELFIVDSTGFSILKELGPLMVAMICTGRAGSAFAAEIGTMKVDEEISALETMGIRPSWFLVLPKLLALMVAMPILTMFGDIIGILGGLTVGVTWLGIPLQAYWARTCDVLTIAALTQGLVKSVVFAVLIALIGCRLGFRADANAQGVGRAATGAVVAAIFAVVIADALMTIVFSIWGY